MDTRRLARVSTSLDTRSLLREERHPNAVTAPPLNRGSMVPRPWRGFWNSLGSGVLATASRLLPPREPRVRVEKAPWQRAADRRRLAFMLLAVLSTVLAAVLFSVAHPSGGNPWLQGAHTVLYVVLSAWVVTGFVTALMGAWVMLFGDRHSVSAAAVRDHAMNPEARTAIIMPICNEDVATVFAGLRATCESLAATGHARQFDVFVLSDSNDARSLPTPSAKPGSSCATRWCRSPVSRPSRSTTACASAAPTARPATSPTSAAAGARTTATWWCSTPTA
jgi:membrane glycosyltransferase